MPLTEILDSKPTAPWSHGGGLPWSDPAFSARMLREHLSQDHDRASRRFATVDLHVEWLHDKVCDGRPSRILDLACGPGFYATRLRSRGHMCVGIDCSPAAIEYAQAHNGGRDDVPCVYRCEDVRTADFGSEFDVVLMTYGQFNSFSPSDGDHIVARAWHGLKAGGALVLEVQSEAAVRSLGTASPTWYKIHQGVFSDQPHICLKESAWHPSERVATELYYVVAVPSGEVTTYVNTTQAYSDDECAALLRRGQFEEPLRMEQPCDVGGAMTDDLVWLVACRPR